MTHSIALQRDHHTGSLFLAWFVLVVLTLASWWFSDHGSGRALATAAILVLSFVKVFMVGHSFMELRHAPRFLRGAFALWCAGICVILVVLALVL